MGFSGTRVIVFDELLGLDQLLRGEARTVADAASGFKVSTAGLPPEAKSVVDGLRGVPSTLERGATRLMDAATAFGQTAADALHIDRQWLELTWEKLTSNLFPPDGSNLPLWIGGRSAFAVGAARRFLARGQMPPWWAKDGKVPPGYRGPLIPVKVGDRVIFSNGPRLHPQVHKFLDDAAKIAKRAGNGLTAADAFRRRWSEGDRGVGLVAGTAAESGSILGCAWAGTKYGARRGWQGAIAGGIVGGAACTGPGRAIGNFTRDRAEDVNGFLDEHTPEPVKDVWKGVKENLDPRRALEGLARPFRP